MIQISGHLPDMCFMLPRILDSIKSFGLPQKGCLQPTLGTTQVLLPACVYFIVRVLCYKYCRQLEPSFYMQSHSLTVYAMLEAVYNVIVVYCVTSQICIFIWTVELPRL